MSKIPYLGTNGYGGAVPPSSGSSGSQNAESNSKFYIFAVLIFMLIGVVLYFLLREDKPSIVAKGGTGSTETSNNPRQSIPPIQGKGWITPSGDRYDSRGLPL